MEPHQDQDKENQANGYLPDSNNQMIMDATPDLWQTPADMKDFLMSSEEVSTIMQINAQALNNCKVDIKSLVKQRQKLNNDLSRVKENIKNLKDETSEHRSQIEEIKSEIQTQDTETYDVSRLNVILSQIV